MSKRYFFDNPSNVKLLLWVFYACCIVLLLGDVVINRHAHHPLEQFFGIYALYGFVACVFLVILAKLLRKVVMREEDHYGD